MEGTAPGRPCEEGASPTRQSRRFEWQTASLLREDAPTRTPGYA